MTEQKLQCNLQNILEALFYSALDFKLLHLDKFCIFIAFFAPH